MKEYISTIIYICIFSIVLELILPENKLKKYIGVLVSIIILLTLISPITTGLENKIVATISEVADNIEFTKEKTSVDFSKLENKVVLSNVKKELEKEMYTSLQKQIKNVTSIEITLNQEYEIEKIIVTAKDVSDVFSAYKITEYLSTTYNINNTLIEVVKEE